MSAIYVRRATLVAAAIGAVLCALSLYFRSPLLAVINGGLVGINLTLFCFLKRI